MLMKYVVFWGITRRRVVVIYRRFGTTCRSHLHWSRFQVGKKAYNKDFINVAAEAKNQGYYFNASS
jgi:hypothetical protein